MNDRTFNRPEPLATYRIQLRSGFGFEQATAVVPYLVELGISHLYASPYLQASAGSTHGYDIEDPTRVDSVLGGDDAHLRFCQALQSAGLGQMIDLVPNHMSIVGHRNRWWWDVLENGPESSHAAYFDVDWHASEGRWPNQVLLPVLGDHYGCELEKGAFSLSHRRGVFELHYYERRFPLAVDSLSDLLGRAAASSDSVQLGHLAERCAQPPAKEEGRRDVHGQAAIKQLLQRLCATDRAAAGAIAREVARINADPDALDALIARQHYRPAFWRSASGDLGYRRFFDINGLIGVRVEEPDVFSATHQLPIHWVRDGRVHGLRIDHPDGLWDPTEYFGRLRQACPDIWIVAEKILEPGETVPPHWPIAGTTGYDYLNRVGGLFIDPRGLAAMSGIYGHFSAETLDYPAVVRQCKQQILGDLFGSELNRLSRLFSRVCEQHRRHRDYTRHELREALGAVAVSFPVYRTYVRAAQEAVSESDVRYVTAAIMRAIAERPDLDPRLLRFLEQILLLRSAGPLEGELAMRFQQLTGSVMAKGVEDTAFYRFNRLVSLNEVGADPDRYPVSPSAFHRACADAQTRYPQTLLATSTHDTKRSEDVRMRLALLSEIPQRWADAANRWAARNDRYRQGGLPDRNTEYLFYQTLVGAWPIDTARMTAYMAKAAREAKRHTSWIRPNQAYEGALHDFVAAVMADGAFLTDLEQFVAPLVMPARINSLAQTLLKLTAPGVPDIYQGTELWDLSLVDPDNRRPVDFALRKRLMAELNRLSLEAIVGRMDEGLPKLWLIRQALHLRRRRPELFGPQGSYRPVLAQGAKADHAVAFLRAERAMSIVPRLIMGLQGGWGDTVLDIPAGRWRNVLSGKMVEGGSVRLEHLLVDFPVSLLAKEE